MSSLPSSDLFDSINEGDEFIHSLVLNERAMRLFEELSGDRSPIHVDDEFARRRGFGGRVAYGNLLGAILSTLVGMKLGGPDVIIASQTIDFRKPILVETAVTLAAHVRQKSAAGRIAELQLTFTTGDGNKVASGKCLVRFL